MEQHVKPMFGYAVVREKAPEEKSAGGVVIPGTVDIRRWFVVEASEGHAQESRYVECMLKPGDEVIPIPRVQQATHPRTGEVMTRQVVETLQPPHFPRDLHLMKLASIAGYTPKDEVKPIVGESPIQLAKAGDMPKGGMH